MNTALTWLGIWAALSVALGVTWAATVGRRRGR